MVENKVQVFVLKMKLVAFLIVVFTFAYADEILTRVTQVFGDIEKKQLNNMDIFLGSEAILVDAQVGKVVEKIIQFPKVNSVH